MKRIVAILGTLLISIVIIISGSAVAAWFYARVIIDSNDCTNIDEILDQEDEIHATLGKNPEEYGAVILDLLEDNEMGPGQEFTVFADTVSGNGMREFYEVFVSQDNITYETVGTDHDQADQTFTTPNTPSSKWRYIIIECVLDGGEYHPTLDPIYGPEVDAVGWDDGT